MPETVPGAPGTVHRTAWCTRSGPRRGTGIPWMLIPERVNGCSAGELALAGQLRLRHYLGHAVRKCTPVLRTLS